MLQQLDGSCPGSFLIDITGLTPNAPIAPASGVSGNFVIPSGSCAGVTLGSCATTNAAVFQ